MSTDTKSFNYKSAIIIGTSIASAGLILPYLLYTYLKPNPFAKKVKEYQLYFNQLVSFRQIMTEAIKRKDFDCLDGQLGLMDTVEFHHFMLPQSEWREYLTAMKADLEKKYQAGQMSDVYCFTAIMRKIDSIITRINQGNSRFYESIPTQ